jgi:hypothetical protein
VPLTTSREVECGFTERTVWHSTNQSHPRAHAFSVQHTKQPQQLPRAAPSTKGWHVEPILESKAPTATAEAHHKAVPSGPPRAQKRSPPHNVGRAVEVTDLALRRRSPTPAESSETGSLISATSPSESGEEPRSPRRRRRPRMPPSVTSSERPLKPPPVSSHEGPRNHSSTSSFKELFSSTSATSTSRSSFATRSMDGSELSVCQDESPGVVSAASPTPATDLSSDFGRVRGMQPTTLIHGDAVFLHFVADVRA